MAKEVKNELVSQTAEQKDPYRVRSSDFAGGKTPANVGTGQGSDGGEMNQLCAQSGNLIGPRHTEDDGSLTPVPGDRAARVSSNFKSAKAAAEGTKVDLSTNVNLETGKVEGGYQFTPVKEVPTHINTRG